MIFLAPKSMVSETKKVSELFHEFKTQRFHIAVVLDEYGNVEGVVTHKGDIIAGLG